MRNFNLNNINSSLGKSLALLLTITASFICCGTAWAGRGFFDEGTSNIKYYYNNGSTGVDAWITGSADTGWGRKNGDTKNIGSVQDLYLKEWWTKVWKDLGSDADDITDVDIHYRLSTAVTPETKNHNYVTNLKSDGTNQQWGNSQDHEGKLNENILDLTSGPGDYELIFYFWAKTKTNVEFKSNDEAKWNVLKFTVPGFIASDYAFVDQAKNQEDVEYTYNFQSFGWTPAHLTLSGSDIITFEDGTQTTKDVTIDGNAGNIKLVFHCNGASIGSYSAKLKLEGTTQGGIKKTKEVNITANVIPETETTVLIADSAYIGDGPSARLQGYVKYTGCDQTLNKRGFFYCKGDCTPTTSSYEISAEKNVTQGTVWTETITTGLEKNTTYRYKAFVYSAIESKYILSDETGTFTTREICHYVEGDTIYYTIDNTQPEDRCALRFQSLSAAVADMKTSDAHNAWLVDDFLTKPVVFNVVASTYSKSDPAKLRDDGLVEINTSNGDEPAKAPDYRLIVRAANPNSKPVFNDGLDLTQSRYITLKNLIVKRYEDDSNSTLELGYYGDGEPANKRVPGKITNCNIEVIGCDFEGEGFACIQGFGCDGLTFEDCNFTMAIVSSGNPDNDKNWGASFKIVGCKNVKFVRNSFKGSHASSMFLQHVQNMLIMNNVFWNDNGYSSNVAFIRPVVFGFDSEHSSDYKIKNIGVYYNTFYLANRDGSQSSEKVDFIRFGGEAQTGNKELYDVANMDFMYNNCYSYDQNIYQRNDNETAFLGYEDADICHFLYNNFWSDVDIAAATSAFGFGCTSYHVNVREQVCATTASDPDGLIIKGGELNLGVKPSRDMSGFNFAYRTRDDRLKENIRPVENSGWTLGAYQQSEGKTINTIVWNGKANSNWDDRNNWVTVDGEPVNCTHAFAENLKVIIPDENSTQYPLPKSGKIENMPIIPAWESERGGIPVEERVEAGLGIPDVETSKFADNIELEYGGVIAGVENLNKDGLHYTSAKSHLTVQRSEWVLVGTVVKPFDGKSGESRNVKSGDYYIANHEPHVYMQHYTTSGSQICPGTPFTSLDEEVNANTAFGIYIPDQYGPNKLISALYYVLYNPNPSMIDDADKPKSFDFNGRFANESALPSYTIKADNSYNFVNNSYPANLDLKEVLKDNSGLNAKYYDYTDKSWNDATSYESSLVKPQNGFVLYSESVSQVNLQNDNFVKGSAKYKSVNAESFLKLSVINGTDKTSSNIFVAYNAQNLPKAFSYNASTPELYVPGENDAKYSTFGIDEMAQIVPLAVRNQQSSKMTIQFSLANSQGFDDIILEDRLLNKTYDLLAGEEPYFANIAAGDLNGRFFLNINYAEEVPTSGKEVKDDGNESNKIYILNADGDNVVISSTGSVMLQKAIITDMAGRTTEIELKDAHYNTISISGMSGAYVIKVVGDIMTETGKVIVR
ncbi:MAG: hypothetical protein MJ010_08815 [Paludibacteraceae bacterium]|nr:hypothetical protein [Paludibacteraceae bacterium]